MDPAKLEEVFNHFISDLPRWIPEGIVEVNLPLLEELGLLEHSQYDEGLEPEQLPHYFHVIETSDKVTLFNHQFVIWIVPQNIEEQTQTIVFIALIHNSNPNLEIAFSTAGVYNSPKFVLKILRHYLSEVIDTEEAISSLEKNPS